MQTGQRWGGRSNPMDLTGVRGRQLKAEADARARQAEAAKHAEEQRSYHLTPEERVAEVQATLKSGVAVWDDEIGDVIVDYTRSYR